MSPSHASARMPRQAATLRRLSADDAATATGVSDMADTSALGLILRLACDKWPDGEHVHLRSLEAIDRLLRGAHDRLILVEARVQNHRDAGLSAESPNQIVVKR